MGIIASATGLGGLIVPFIVHGIIETLGGPWMLRILSMAWFVIFVTAYGLIREHEQSKTKPTGLRGILKWSLFKNLPFSLWCVSGCFQVIHCFLVPFTLPGTVQ